jgi:hypothetical protein
MLEPDSCCRRSNQAGVSARNHSKFRETSGRLRSLPAEVGDLQAANIRSRSTERNTICSELFRPSGPNEGLQRWCAHAMTMLSMLSLPAFVPT